jgi:hypothetical protein
MKIKRGHDPLNIEHFHAVTAVTCKLTILESQLNHSLDMGRFTLHHGTRNGAPIVIAEHHDQNADELSGIWFDDSQ